MSSLPWTFCRHPLFLVLNLTFFEAVWNIWKVKLPRFKAQGDGAFHRKKTRTFESFVIGEKKDVIFCCCFTVRIISLTTCAHIYCCSRSDWLKRLINQEGIQGPVPRVWRHPMHRGLHYRQLVWHAPFNSVLIDQGEAYSARGHSKSEQPLEVQREGNETRITLAVYRVLQHETLQSLHSDLKPPDGNNNLQLGMGLSSKLSAAIFLTGERNQTLHNSEKEPNFQSLTVCVASPRAN